MSTFQQMPWLGALAAFAAVLLAMFALVLLWEGVRQWRRQHAVSEGLRRLSEGRSDRTLGGLLRPSEKAGPEWLEPLVLRMPRRQDLQHMLEQARMSWSVGTFVLLTVGLAAALWLGLLVVSANWILPLAGAAAGALIPYFIVSRKRRKRFQKFEEHFPEAIDLLCRAIRAGHAFSTGLSVVAEESLPPINEEFRHVYEEQKFGLPLPDSLHSLADRISLLDVRIFVTAVLIQLESGGNLAEILDNLATVIRRRFKFRRQLKTHTAHGRMTAMVLVGAPVVAGLLMFGVNPDYMRPLVTEPIGRMMLTVAAISQLMGFLWIRRLIDLEA